MTTQETRLRRHLQSLVKSAGRVTEVIIYEPAKGGGWSAIFDTEYAALKAFYAYRLTKGISFGESPNCGGWHVSYQPDAR